MKCSRVPDSAANSYCPDRCNKAIGCDNNTQMSSPEPIHGETLLTRF